MNIELRPALIGSALVTALAVLTVQLGIAALPGIDPHAWSWQLVSMVAGLAAGQGFLALVDRVADPELDC